MPAFNQVKFGNYINRFIVSGPKIYVDPTFGDDSFDGSQAYPYLTVARAAADLGGLNEFIIIKGGTIVEDPIIIEGVDNFSILGLGNPIFGPPILARVCAPFLRGFEPTPPPRA